MMGEPSVRTGRAARAVDSSREQKEGDRSSCSRARSRSRSTSGSRKDITCELGAIERALTSPEVFTWYSTGKWDMGGSAVPTTNGLDSLMPGVDVYALKDQLFHVHEAWRICVDTPSNARGTAERIIQMVNVINECGKIREATGDEEIWLSLHLMFSDYVTFTLAEKTLTTNPVFACESNALRFCGLCQTRAMNQEPSHLVIRKSHLQPRFIQNFVFLRALPTNTSTMDVELAQCFDNVRGIIEESTADIACLPLLCQCTDSTGQGCEDLFSRWESKARDLLFASVIENLKNPEPVTFPVTHHVYKFAVSLIFRGILSLPRLANWKVCMQGFRAARWILRRHGSYRDVFPVYFAVPNIQSERDEAIYLNEPDPLAKRAFIRELLDSSRVTISGDCVIVSAGPIHFMVDCSFNSELEKSLQNAGTNVLELLSFFVTMEGNGKRSVPLCIQNAAMYRAKTEPALERNPSAEIALAKCILENSDRSLIRIMAQHKIDVETWSATHS